MRSFVQGFCLGVYVLIPLPPVSRSGYILPVHAVATSVQKVSLVILAVGLFL